jgi:hypothetical protein
MTNVKKKKFFIYLEPLRKKTSFFEMSGTTATLVRIPEAQNPGSGLT